MNIIVKDIKRLESKMFKFKKMTKEDMPLVLEWRIKPTVTKYLFTKVENNLDNQYAWFEKMNKDESYKYWVIEYNTKAIGVINLADLDLKNSRCNAGYYIGEEEYLNLGGIVLPYFYNYIFNELNINKIYGEVVDGNNILKLHLIHGYKHIGTFREHISIDGKFKDVHLVELLSSDWKNQRRYKKYIAEFE